MGHVALDSNIAQVFDLVHGVRRRWRWARVLRGAAIALAGLLATLIVAAIVLDRSGYSAGVVIAGRVGVIVVAVVLLGIFVVLPLLPHPRDAQVALYTEEHEPSLNGALISAVEISEAGSPFARPAADSLATHVRRAAIERTHAVNDARAIDGAPLWRAASAVGAMAIGLAMLLTLGPDSLRHGMGALLAPWESAEAANPYRVEVRPGNATVARGASVLVSANTVGFQAEGVELFARTSDTAAWTRVPMIVDSARQFTARLLDVAAATHYFVESNGIRSRTYRLDVADLPYTKRIDLEYHFPAYTGLPVQHVDSGGDIAALAGTSVKVHVTPTRQTSGGRLVVDGGDTLKLAPMPDGSLVGTLRVARPGFYRVELEGARGDLLTASLNYAIDVLPDRPPSVSFTKPGRDTKVLAVDEVYTEARAEDDYGVSRLELVYSVNGAAERALSLHESTARVIRDIAAGHTFMLEDYQLEPGDVVSYYARARDNDAVHGSKSVSSDIYFLQVRPYSQEYRQAQEGGGGGGGGSGEQQGQLSQRQREIIAGTFNSLRDSATTERRGLEEDVATLRLAQQRLKDDAGTLGRNLVQRGITSSDSNFARIEQILRVATAAMDTAEQKLADSRMRDALGPEQRALQQLQRAEAVFREIRVSMGNEGGGGGGGGASQAEDLADLFELQRERMRNQYETVQRGSDEQQQAEQQVDATAERLKQLAARQQQQNERARRKADSLNLGASGASGGDAQRQLAQEAEQTARQLERLARERQSQSLADAARRLNEAADAMRRSASSGGQQGAASSAAASDRLREASRLLEQERNSRAQRAGEEAAATGRRLAQEQRQVTEDVARASAMSPQDREEMQQRIAQRKGAMADTARALGGRLDRAALDAQRNQPAAGRELAEAADTLRARRIEDKLRTTQARIRDIPPEQQEAIERMITSDIEKLNRALEEARVASQSGASDAGRSAQAADRARDLVRGMESLDERLRQQQDQRGGAQPGGGGDSGQGGQQGGQQGGREGGQQSGQRLGGGQGTQRSMGQPGGGGQFGRELRERLNDARALRRDLAQRGGVDVSQLDRAIRDMERLGGSLEDPRATRELRTQVIEGLRSFEYSLGGTLRGKSERVLVDRAGEVPPEYRKYVEEYYRSLARTKPR